MPVTTAAAKKVRAGSRDSKLALVQTELVIGKLQAGHPGLEVSLETMKTIGDKIQDVAMNKIGDKGLFTKELEAGLSGKMIDLVVHSLKDMPTTLPDNMELAAITAREDPRDAVVMSQANETQYSSLEELPAGSVVGTGSVRRVAQLRRLYPGLEFRDIRGNLNTRLRKLDEGEYDALVLAVAGLKRLGMGGRIAQTLDAVLYAVGQGALGVEVRSDDLHTLDLVRCLNDMTARRECLAERELMKVLEGGCSVPIGVRSQWTGGGRRLGISAIVASVDGARAVEAEASADVDSDQQAMELGARLAALMRERGADAILNEIQH
ncbi:hypothetical protein GGF46_004523 [Coemansia sp. RSA 552]|nr:hypothetical protein GGF46_004523 [Coemansia sp. RSA 552]